MVQLCRGTDGVNVTEAMLLRQCVNNGRESVRGLKRSGLVEWYVGGRRQQAWFQRCVTVARRRDAERQNSAQVCHRRELQ